MSRGYRVLGVVAGVPMLASGIVLALKAQHGESLGAAGIISTYVWAVLLLVSGLYFLYVAGTVHAYDVEITEVGLRDLATGRMTPWSSVAALRERFLFQRVELVGHQGERLARLEFQLEGFEVALRQVVDACGAVSPLRRPAAFRPMESEQWGVFAGLFVGLALIFAAAALVVVPAAVIFPIVAMPLMLIAWRISRNATTLALLVSPSSIRVTIGSATQETPLAEVEDVLLGLRSLGKGWQTLSVSLVRRTGEPLEIRPRFTDACALFVTVRAAWLASASSETPLLDR